MSITVRAVEGRQLIEPALSYSPSRGAPITVTADTAELRANPADGAPMVRFVDMQYDFGNGRRGTWPGVFEYPIPLDDFSRSKKKSLSPSNCPLAKIPSAIDEQESRIAGQARAGSHGRL